MARVSSSGRRSIEEVEKDSDSSVSIRQGVAEGGVEKRLDDTAKDSSGDNESPGQQGADVETVEEADEALGDNVSTQEKPTSGLPGVLSRIVSRASTADPGPPPDGGLHAWMIGKKKPPSPPPLTKGKVKIADRAFQP